MTRRTAALTAAILVVLVPLGSGCGGQDSEDAAPTEARSPTSEPADTTTAEEAQTEKDQWLGEFSSFLLGLDFATARMGSIRDPAAVLESQHNRTRLGAGARLLATCSANLPAGEPLTAELAELAALGKTACRHFERASKQILSALAAENAKQLENAARAYAAGKDAFERADQAFEEMKQE